MNKNYHVNMDVVKIIIESANVAEIGCYSGRYRKDLVQLELVESGVRINATDGKILSSITVFDDGLIALMKDHGDTVGYLGTLEINLLDVKHRYFRKQKHVIIELDKFYFTELKGEFPSIEKLLQDDRNSGEDGDPIYFNVDLFNRVSKVIAMAGRDKHRHKGVKLTPKKQAGGVINISPYEADCNVKSATMLLMPLRSPTGVA